MSSLEISWFALTTFIHGGVVCYSFVSMLIRPIGSFWFKYSFEFCPRQRG